MMHTTPCMTCGQLSDHTIMNHKRVSNVKTDSDINLDHHG